MSYLLPTSTILLLFALCLFLVIKLLLLLLLLPLLPLTSILISTEICILITTRNLPPITCHVLYILLHLLIGSRSNPGIGGSGSVIYSSNMSSDKDIKGSSMVMSECTEVWYGYHYLGNHGGSMSVAAFLCYTCYRDH